MTTLAKVRKGVYPRPVYEAHFSDKTYVRLSVWSPAGKPLAVDRARNLINTMTGWTVTHLPTLCRIERGNLTGKRLVRGYVEHDVPGQPWVRFLDPAFSPHAVIETAKAKRQTARRVKAILADLVAYLDGDGPDDALQRARDLIAA